MLFKYMVGIPLADQIQIWFSTHLMTSTSTVININYIFTQGGGHYHVCILHILYNICINTLWQILIVQCLWCCTTPRIPSCNLCQKWVFHIGNKFIRTANFRDVSTELFIYLFLECLMVRRWKTIQETSNEQHVGWTSPAKGSLKCSGSKNGYLIYMECWYGILRCRREPDRGKKVGDWPWRRKADGTVEGASTKELIEEFKRKGRALATLDAQAQIRAEHSAGLVQNWPHPIFEMGSPT